MRKIVRGFYKLILLTKRSMYKILIMPFRKLMFAECGKKVTIRPGGEYTYQNIYVGKFLFL